MKPLSERQTSHFTKSCDRPRLEFHTANHIPSWKVYERGMSYGDFTREYNGGLSISITETYGTDSGKDVTRQVLVHLSLETTERLRELLNQPKPEVKS